MGAHQPQGPLDLLYKDDPTASSGRTYGRRAGPMPGQERSNNKYLDHSQGKHGVPPWIWGCKEKGQCQ
jgi:hypothetical protein